METSTGILDYSLKGCMEGGFLEMTLTGMKRFPTVVFSYEICA
jgi:hypothetical protein